MTDPTSAPPAQRRFVWPASAAKSPLREVGTRAARLLASQPHFVEPDSTTNPAERRPDSARRLEMRRSPHRGRNAGFVVPANGSHQLRGG